METIIFHPETDKNAIAEAAAILRRGGLLGIPTETVYGLGADGLNEDAVRRIFEAKGRPQDNPLILHVRTRAGWNAAVWISPTRPMRWRNGFGRGR